MVVVQAVLDPSEFRGASAVVIDDCMHLLTMPDMAMLQHCLYGFPPDILIFIIISIKPVRCYGTILNQTSNFYMFNFHVNSISSTCVRHRVLDVLENFLSNYIKFDAISSIRYHFIRTSHIYNIKALARKLYLIGTELQSE
jgi:hypothetical protein